MSFLSGVRDDRRTGAQNPAARRVPATSGTTVRRTKAGGKQKTRESELHCGSAGGGLCFQTEAGAQSLGSGGECFRGWGPPALGRVEGPGGGAQLGHASPLGCPAHGVSRRSTKAQIRCDQAKLIEQLGRHPLCDPQEREVAVEPCHERGPEQINGTGGRRAQPCPRGRGGSRVASSLEGDDGGAGRALREARHPPVSDRSGKPPRCSSTHDRHRARTECGEHRAGVAGNLGEQRGPGATMRSAGAAAGSSAPAQDRRRPP